jgi:mono/diheme cytochrome c family protein
MHSPTFARLLLAASIVFVLTLVTAVTRAQEAAAPADGHGGWRVPEDAKSEQNPLESTPQVLAAGRALFLKNCRRCHGPKGVGDGPDAEMEHMADMDLTNPDRAAENPDGVVFYKAWNGREDPKMPAFKNELTREQVWAIVTYVQTLRQTSRQ